MVLKKGKIVGGFFAERLETNAKITIKSIYERFAETGRFAAMKCKKSQTPTHIFWDSDVAKWLESAAYLLARREDEQIRAWFNEAVEDILANQLPCGYFNSYFQVYESENIFKRRTEHELYCAGHLFEAAVAASEYLGDDRLLLFSEKYIDYIYDRFVTKKDAAFTTPGHEEIELALLRLYALTRKEKYKELAKFFLDERGTREEEEYARGVHYYSQSRVPVREQTEAEGHAVRALYLYIAMADLAKTDGDLALRSAAEKLFDDVATKKMYVTGGVGSAHCGERFSCAYDLPNFTAYNETCAAIAFAMFCDKMLRLTGEAKYAETFERVLYNGILCGISLKGDAFFYVNPVEMQRDRAEYNEKLRAWKEGYPLLERAKIFDCSCCPPNLSRFIERLSEFIWYADEEKGEVTLAQYISSSLQCDLADVEMQSNFPYDGKVTLKIDSHGKKLKLRLRVPQWCDKKFAEEKDGYLLFEKVFDNELLEAEFPMKARTIYANPLVNEDAGKVAFSYGPLILCAEGIDNPFALSAVSVDPKQKAEVQIAYDSPSVVSVRIPAFCALPSETLYFYDAPETKKIALRLIPYFAWNNRGATDMKVWFPTGVHRVW